VFDQMGRVVIEQRVGADTHLLQLDFAAQNLGNGEYYVRMASNSGVVVQKLSLQLELRH
jgi:hypothetical protein